MCLNFQVEITMDIKFAKLWSSHPLNWSPPEAHPCRSPDGTWHSSLDNQCAIKLSIALAGAGINMSVCRERKCWLKGHKNHVLVAQKLANWLAQPSRLSKPTKFIKKGIEQAVFQDNVVNSIKGMNGVVFCQDFWGTNNQGDHIDVWKSSTMSNNQVYDYFGRSKEVWFWRITT